MLQHQVLTGSANAGSHCYSVGQVSKFTFWAYGSGCDVIISSSNHHPIQVISGHNNVLITAIDCAASSGKIAVAYGKEIVIYKPELETLYSNPNFWHKESQFSLDLNDNIASILSWNLEGNELLVGSSCISLWSCASSSDDLSTVFFHLDNNDVDATESNSETFITWKQIWASGMHELPTHLSFSPTQSRYHLFASITGGDCMIKVWYSYTKHTDHVNVLSKPSTDQIDFSFSYLLHPQPVVGFEWRKNLIIDGAERFSNVLMSSCQDQICRIWVETKRPISNLMHFQPISSPGTKPNLTNETQSDKFKKTASTPILSNNSEMLWKQFQSKMETSTLRHFHIASTINPSSDIPLLPSFNLQTIPTSAFDGEKMPVFTVHWLNNKFYQHQVHYSKFCAENRLHSNVNQCNVSDGWLNSSNHESNDSLDSTIVENLIRFWRESRDALFSIHPSDGSLLVWHIDWLDEDRSSLIRQPQVCFSSRIPMVFASGDAATVCPRMILFVNYAAEQNLLHSASCMSFKSEDDDKDKEVMIYSDVKLLSKHNDGSLNLWQISFSDANDFSSVTSISHSLRLCGHCFHMSGILSHPILPLLVTTATQADSTVANNSVSELILWRMNPIGPLAHSGGLSELARVSCQEDHSFSRVAWFSLLFPNWCLGSDNKSPSTGLIAFDNNQIQVYQAVVDASQILSEIMSPVVENQAYSTRDIISQQSSTQPGCLLHLHTESDTIKPWGPILFLDTFDVTLLSSSLQGMDSNSFFKFSKSYFVVMVEKSDNDTYIHTWLVTFFSTQANAKEQRQRKTTMQLYDSSEDESEEEISYNVSSSFSNVETTVRKLATQKLDISDDVVDTCSGVGKFNLFFMADHNEHIHAAPFHLCTLSKTGQVHFWHCYVEERLADKSFQCSWNMWEPPDYQPNSISTSISSSYHIPVSGYPVLIKAANNTLLACMSIDKRSNDIGIIVSVFECSSSGGSCWKSQDILTYSLQLSSADDIAINNLHLGWLSRQDGSFFLAMGYDSHIEIYALAPKDLFRENLHEAEIDHTHQLRKQASLDIHTRQKLFTSSFKGEKVSLIKSQLEWRLLKWTKVTELNIQNSNRTSNSVPNDQKTSKGPVTASWARDGILIVATETEMHVFSQWLDKDKQDGKLTQAIKMTVGDSDVPVTKGLFEVAAGLCPSLQQYHPLILSELLNSGHMAAVRKILIHLAICINGDYQDITCQQISTQLSKYHFCDQLSHIIQLCTSGNRITPFPIHNLVQNNGKIVSTSESPSSQIKKSVDIDLSKPVEMSDTLDDFLDNEDDNDEQSLNELDEILGIKPSRKKKPKAVEHVDLSKFDPNYFGKEHCKVINEFLTRNQLPGLTSLDQMELMALADTLNLANASNLQELSDDKSNDKLHAVNLGERGYAVSGSGAGSLDSCGIRYIMAVHNHLCLLNSLPASNKAALLKQGLSTCQFAWAFHSDTEEEMLSLLPSVQRGSPEWPELKAFGVVWWIRSTALLRRLVEQLARASFLRKNDPLDAALFYLALNKKAVICGLYRTIKDERMHQFFQRNFSEDRWRRAALKNAFALMGKQRFLHAVAFFLLAGAVQDAAEICIEKLKDFQLALLIVQLRENAQISPVLLLKDHILPDDSEKDKAKRSRFKMKADSFVRSMAYWTVGKYEKSLDTLLDNLEHEDVTDVFNFYMFLRSHPLLLRNKVQLKGGRLGAWNVSASSIKNATEKERQLIFQTAVVHMEAGCPMLALDCLSMLPENITVTSTDAAISKPSVTDLNRDLNLGIESTSQVNSIHDDDLIQHANKSNIQKNQMQEIDWSQPVGFDDDEELTLDWSEEDPEESEDDASRPRISVSLENPIVHAPSVLENDVVVDEEISNVEALLEQDVFAKHMKMTACFQVFVQELKAIANAYNADGGQLRTKLYNWLENASNTLQRVFVGDSFTNCSSGLNPVSKKVTMVESSPETDEYSSLNSLGAKMSSSQPPSLHELILADNEDWKARRDDFTQRRKWLVCHHNFLRTLLSYCILHDSACGILATVRMELLLLIQESLQEKNATRSLAAPLPQPSDSIPLLTSSIASCKTVVADPLTYLCHMTRDILRAVLDFSFPPHPNDETDFAKSAMLCSQAAALSTCIYQSLCDTSTPTFRSQLLRADTNSLDGASVDGNCFSSSPSSHSTSHNVPPLYIAPTTAPSQWPGVALLQAKLHSEGVSDNRTKVLILLCEVTVSVYISLLIHALYTYSTSLLYRLTNHVLGSKMWNAVFGGGAKIPIKYTKSSSNLKQMASMNISKLRERLNHKVLSTSGDKRGSASASSGGQDSLAYQEKFVPPEIGLWDWFLTKPFRIPAADDEIDYDSDAEDGSEVSSLEDEYIYNELEENQPSHETSPNSFSWKIMRLAIVKIVITNLQSFFPLVGFELNELSTNSPFLFAIIRILQEWQSKLSADVENCDNKPEDVLLSMNCQPAGVSTSRPAMLRYQAILEPANTPFSGSDKVSIGCRRLWHSLVKKEQLQDMFINYIFRDDNKTSLNLRNAESQAMQTTSTIMKRFESPSRIVHKDHDLITAFCINNVNSNCISIASAKDVQEIDLSDMLASDSWSWIDDSSSIGEKSSTLSKDDDFLVIATPSKPRGSQVFAPSTTIPWSSTSQTGQGANILLKRNLSNIRRMESHPTLPYYVTGGRDGAMYMWEWGHQHQISQFLPPGHTSKVCNIHFSSLGNKICSADGDGFVTLWQVSLSQRPFFKHLVHDRGASDFCFLSSASVLATTGLSSSSRNVAVWDTLLPRKSVLVQDFSVYEQAGGSCIKYLSRYRMLLVAGKNGHICTYDERSLHAPVHRFAAHDAMIKCLAVDPNDRFYVTGSSNGDIKVWDSLSHKLLFSSSSEHTRASLFKNFGSGTMQLSLHNGHLYSCGADGSLKMKELPTGNRV